MIRRSSIALAKICVVALAVVAATVGLFLWGLSMSPLSLPGLRAGIEAQLSQARGGRPVKIGGVELAWGRQRASLELRARDVRPLDSHGAELTRSKNVVIGLSLGALATGRIAVTDVIFNGGDVTVTQGQDGSQSIAFGPPGAQPDIVLPPSPPDEGLRQKVGRLLDGLRAALAPVGSGGRLHALSMHGARLTIVDQKTGGVWTGRDANFDLERAGPRVSMRASASLKGAQGPAPFIASIETNNKFDAATIDLTVRGARVQALGPFAPKGPFSGLTAPATIAVKAAIDRARGLTLLNGNLSLGRGVFDVGGGQLQLTGGKLSGRYDVARDTLVLGDLSLNGASTRLNGDARITHASAILAGDPQRVAEFRISSPQINFNMPGAFSGPVSIAGLLVSGEIRPDAISFDKIQGVVEAGRLDFKGRVYWADDGKGRVRPGIQMTGGVTGALSVKSVLRMWPLQLAEGARSWLGDAILDGRMYDIALNADITPADFSADAGVPDDKLSVKFKFDRAAVRYLQSMTPIVNGFGDAELKGNSFALSLERGVVGDMTVSAGKVLLPRIYPKGALASYGGHVDGDVRSMVNLLRQAPIGLDPKLPFAPATITGRGGVDFVIMRPLRHDVADDEVKFKVDGRLDNAGGVAKSGAFTVAQWKLRVVGDESALNFSGPLSIGPKSHADLNWSEKLRGHLPSPSTIALRGKLDAADIVSLGFPVLEYASGPVGVDLRAAGKGVDANSGQAQLDFRDAVVSLPKGFWVKPAGQAMNVTFALARQRDNTLMLNDIAASGAGVSATGQAHISALGDLLDATAPRMVLQGSMDARVSARRAPAGFLDVAVAGPFLNVAPFFTPDADPAHVAAHVQAAAAAPVKPGRLSPAFQIRGEADTLRLRGEADLTKGAVFASSDGFAMTKFTLNGADPAGQQMTLSIAPIAGQPVGQVSLRSADAGFAVRAITGQANVRGGTVEADGTWRFAISPTAQIHLKMRNFRLVQVPAMASLLGSVASLTGMVDMLNGEGIQFGALEAPLTIADNQLTLGECRAAGPSIGLTAKGGINLNDGKLDIDGVIVPSYGLNSMLGHVPVLGDLLVSRKGEGIFGLTYSLNGPANKPRVGVNPLSAFTPGIFRRIFEPLQKPAEREKEG